MAVRISRMVNISTSAVPNPWLDHPVLYQPTLQASEESKILSIIFLLVLEQLYSHEVEGKGGGPEILIFDKTQWLVSGQGSVLSLNCIVKLHSNLQTQLNFSWLEKELTLFSHGRKEEGRRKVTVLWVSRGCFKIV